MTTIRGLRPDDDLGDLIALSREFFDEYESHHADFFEIDVLRDSDIVDYFIRSLEGDDGATFIALVNGHIVGYITVFARSQAHFYRIRKVGAISGLMVHRDHRRKGIGSQLYRAAETFFASKEIAYYTVYTATENQGAVQFYERNGMAPLHTTLIGTTGIGDA